MKAVDLVAVNRLVRLLGVITEDARQLVAANRLGEQLQHEVKLAAAVAAQLAKALKLAEMDAELTSHASALAADAISKAKSRQCD